MLVPGRVYGWHNFLPLDACKIMCIITIVMTLGPCPPNAQPRDHEVKTGTHGLSRNFGVEKCLQPKIQNDGKKNISLTCFMFRMQQIDCLMAPFCCWMKEMQSALLWTRKKSHQPTEIDVGPWFDIVNRIVQVASKSAVVLVGDKVYKVGVGLWWLTRLISHQNHQNKLSPETSLTNSAWRAQQKTLRFSQTREVLCEEPGN